MGEVSNSQALMEEKLKSLEEHQMSLQGDTVDAIRALLNLEHRVTVLEDRINKIEKYMERIGQTTQIINDNVNAIMTEVYSVSSKTNQLDKMLLGH